MQRFLYTGLLAAAGLCLVLNYPAAAQSPPQNHVTCNDPHEDFKDVSCGWCGERGPNILSAEFHTTMSEFEKHQERTSWNRWLDSWLDSAIAYCKQNPTVARSSSGNITFRPAEAYVINVIGHSDLPNGGYARLTGRKAPRKGWEFSGAYVDQEVMKWRTAVALKQELDRVEAEKAERIAQQQQAHAREANAIRTAFIHSNSVERLVADFEVLSNPFVMKDKIVGIRTKFGRMLSENEALFSLNNIQILAVGVPPTQFSVGGEDIVLALKIKGTRAVKTATGEIVLPYGEYVGVYKCTMRGCDDFSD